MSSLNILLHKYFSGTSLVCYVIINNDLNHISRFLKLILAIVQKDVGNVRIECVRVSCFEFEMFATV